MCSSGDIHGARFKRNHICGKNVDAASLPRSKAAGSHFYVINGGDRFHIEAIGIPSGVSHLDSGLFRVVSVVLLDAISWSRKNRNDGRRDCLEYNMECFA